MTAVRNDALIKTLETTFVRSHAAATAWGNTVGNHLLLPQLRGAWPFSSVNESGNVYDLSGQGRILTNNNAVPFGIMGLAPYADLTPASSHYFSRADEAGLDITGGLSISAWAWFDAAGAMGILSKYETVGNQRSYRILKNASNVIIFGVSGDGIAAVTATGPTVTTGQWYHLCGVYNPSTELSIWVNGVEYSNTTAIPASIFNSTSAFEIGRTSGGSYLDGRMRLVSISAVNYPNAMVLSIYHQCRALFGR